MIMRHCQYFKFIILMNLIINEVDSWNYYRSSRQIDVPKACTFIKCKADERCVNRKFGCKFPPCPDMIYCAKTHIESLRGPSSCDTVQCSKGHICIVKVRHCKWNEPCGEELARCITEMEYHNGPAFCAGYKCPAGHDCILRESLCVRPPCKLLRSCVTKLDYQKLLGKCQALGCLSSHECFLRRPGNVCESPPCKHSPDCIAKTATQLSTIDEKCRGWICPLNQTCEAETPEPCDNINCKIFRSCHDQFNNYDNKYNLDDDNHDNDNNDDDGDDKRKHNSNQTSVHWRTELPQLNKMNGNDTISTYGRSTDKSLLDDVNPTLSSLSLWMNYLKNEIGIEAVKKWIQKAEEDNDYPGFYEWLKSAKELLGVKVYSHWLDEIRNITASNKAFQLWLPPSDILKSPNSHESSAAGNGNNIENAAEWTSSDTDFKKGIYSTQSLMNPLYQHQNMAFPPSNVPRIFPYLFAPVNNKDGTTGRHYGYFILPPVRYSSSEHDNSPDPTVESHQREMFRQLMDNSGDAEATKRADLVTLLQKLKEERLLYQEVINKTQELVARARPLLPLSHLDKIVQRLQSNKLLMNNFDDNSSITQKILTEEPKYIKNISNSSDVSEVIGKVNNIGSNNNDYSPDDETEFFLVDYNEPSTFNMNETLPRILVKVENNLDSPMRIGEIGVKYNERKSIKTSSNQHSTNSFNNKNDYEDYDAGDFHYKLKVPINNTEKVATAFDSLKDISKT